MANEIDIAYPDGESGTFEYFCEVALEEVCSFRTGQQSADDNVLVTALVGNGDAIGYFGYAYYVENQDTLTAAPIRNGDGVYVTPTSTTVRDGSYEPLSRPLFMNVHINAASLVKTIPFIVYGLDTHAGQEAVAEVGYVALNDAQLADMMHRRLTVLAVTYTDSDYSLRGELCGQGQTITIAGSSTVKPLAEAWAQDFQAFCSGYTISVEGGGSGAGAGRVCGNSAKGTPVNIGDMSRDWKATEASRGTDGYTMSCLAGDTTITVTQLTVAIDGLSVVMKSGGAAAACVGAMGGLTVPQLRWIFSTNSTADVAFENGLPPSAIAANDDGDSTKEWGDLSTSSACMDDEIDIVLPDGESGTYEYFNEVVLDEKGQFRTGTQSADDNVLVEGLTGNGDAIGYFGYAYYIANTDVLVAAAVENSAGQMVLPTSTTVRDGTYEPLSRPMFMNVNNADWGKVKPFLEWAWSSLGEESIHEVGYVPLDQATWYEMSERFQ